MTPLEIAHGVTLTHPEAWIPPYLATVTLADDTRLQVNVLEAAVPSVREAAMLCYVMNQRASVELQGNTLTRVWMD